ncbi:hypothetical protein GOODEAATRI_030963, partial [Goodea atripinnis]
GGESDSVTEASAVPDLTGGDAFQTPDTALPITRARKRKKKLTWQGPQNVNTLLIALNLCYVMLLYSLPQIQKGPLNLRLMRVQWELVLSSYRKVKMELIIPFVIFLGSLTEASLTIPSLRRKPWLCFWPYNTLRYTLDPVLLQLWSTLTITHLSS